jgi:hypothetical protein
VDLRVTTPAGGAATPHEPIQHPRGLDADAAGRLRDARERGIGQFADELIVVHTDDGDLVGHPQADAGTGLEHVAGPDVIAGHDTNRLGKRPQPVAEFMLEGRPLGGVVPGRKRRAGVTGIGQALAVGGSAGRRPDHRRPRRKSVIGEAGKTTIEQVFRSEDGDPDVVGVDVRDPARRIVKPASAAHRHERQPRPLHRACHPLVVEGRDDPLTLPGGEVGKPPTLFLFDVEPPIADLAGVLCHPLGDLTVIGDRGIDDDGDKPHARRPGCDRTRCGRLGPTRIT